MKKDRAVYIAVFALISLILLCQYQVRAPKRGFSDYRVYYDAGKDMLEGRSIYEYNADEITPFKYAPVFAVFMAPISVFSKPVSAGIFFTLNMLWLFLIFEISRRMIFFEKMASGRQYLVFAAVFLISFRSILHCLHSGQVGILIVFLVLYGLFLIGRGRDIAAGFLIGFAVMIKYMPFVFVLYFLAKKKIKAACAVIAAMAFYAFLPSVITGFKANITLLGQWLPHITSTSLDGGSFLDIKNHSLWTITRRLAGAGNEMPALIATVVIFILTFYLILKPSPKDKQNNGKTLFIQSVDYAMLFIIMVLFNPNAWLHNFAAMVFPLTVVFYYLLKGGFKERGVLFLLIASFVLSSSGSYSIAGKAAQAMFEYYGAIICSSLLLFWALLIIKSKGCDA
ncbi:MAG: glycosyltransferase family 87 protein [Candidatus Omnitrophica bacterium]|nr:glycosyltransferase family 87 protein [Candidatus Omnitrophota bacterium]